MAHQARHIRTSAITNQPPAAVRFHRYRSGSRGGMRLGNVEIRPLGGGLGCLLMIVGSILLSVLCTIGANLVSR
jgi:hypothetical protein